jgi:hypothetical protein
MKKLGLSILIIGLAITLFAGFQFMTRKNVIDVGDLHISHNEMHTANWSPAVGIVVMVVGGIILVFSSKKG